MNDRAGVRDLAVGDVNGDGFADLLSGSRVNWESRELTFGGPDGLANVTQNIPGVERGPAAIGDLDGDGFAEVAIGDPEAWRGDEGAAGQVRVWKGSADGNGDGYGDLAIGASEDVGALRNGGTVTVINGSASGPNLQQAR